MKAQYGYTDGSGTYYIIVDTDKCDGCKKCEEACPAGVMIVGEDENDPLNDQEVAKVNDAERKKLKYTCANAGCKPEGQKGTEKCILACEPGALEHTW
jgi:Fe-S-cluster-containing hydrogenase component 2